MFISFCDSVPGDSLVFHQENRGYLRIWLGIWDCSAYNAGESSLISQRGGCLVRFLELWQEPGVYSRVTGGWIFETPLFSAKSGILCSYEGHLRNITRLGRLIQTLLELRWDTKGPFLVSKEILGFLSIFKKSQASSSFEALNSTSLSRSQRM